MVPGAESNHRHEDFQSNMAVIETFDIVSCFIGATTSKQLNLNKFLRLLKGR